jgi:hypothetical protein
MCLTGVAGHEMEPATRSLDWVSISRRQNSVRELFACTAILHCDFPAGYTVFVWLLSLSCMVLFLICFRNYKRHANSDEDNRWNDMYKEVSHA